MWEISKTSMQTLFVMDQNDSEDEGRNYNLINEESQCYLVCEVTDSAKSLSAER